MSLQRKINCLKKKVLDLSVSVNHAAFVVSGGYVFTLGDNSEGQLGLGHKKDAASQPSVVKKLFDKFVQVS
jgi:alpha-tubulin suppressor-like RCC1 family protein